MAVLEIDRIHARYLHADTSAAQHLDRALRSVAEEDLAAEVAVRVLPQAHAVCLRTLDVRVELDPGLVTASLSRRWADAIAAALVERVAATGDDDDMVVYRREVDLVVDVVSSVAVGDHARLWAWQQAGAIDRSGGWPGWPQVVTLLERRPTLVPGVLRTAPSAVASVLDDDGWRAIARSVRTAVAVAPSDHAMSSDHAMRRPFETALDADVVSAARRVVPDRVWAGSTVEQAVDLAVLALACAAPASSRDRHAVARVVAVEANTGAASERPEPAGHRGPIAEPRTRVSQLDGGIATTSSVVPRPPLPSAAGSTTTGRATETANEPDALGVAVSDPSDGHEPDHEPATSWFGGVMYLVHAITALDLATEEPSWDGRARVIAAATGVAADDAAVLVAAGAPPAPELDRLHAALDEATIGRIDGMARRLDAWVRERLDRSGDSGSGDLAWVWRRHATIEVEPGWIDATFALTDVDIRLRVAGLDLDPGYVWWLGQVVRFRHV
ncbi:MAG: hypothetical protein JJE52_16415 [Acidimicrobiia bacterium]|nr:hypothetical protein [Acidimicrobiia bacterium]